MKKLIIILAFLFVSYGHSNPSEVKKSCKTMENYLQEIFNDIVSMQIDYPKIAKSYTDENYKLAIIYQAICKD